MVRRSTLGRNVACIIAASVAFVAIADGAPIRFDNPPGAEHFVWYGSTAEPGIGLEIISDAASQSGAFGGPAQFVQRNKLRGNDYVKTPTGSFLQVGGSENMFLVGVDEGTLIPSGTPWRTNVCYIYHPSYGTWLPEGVPTYLGAQFSMADGMHYGWIGVVMFQGAEQPPYGYPRELDAFAWGYETEPDTPIIAGIPEPGTLALLAVGAVVALRPRRLRSQID